MDFEAHRGKQPPVPSGSGTQLKNSPGLWVRGPKPACNVLGFSLIVLIGVKQIVVSRILFEIQSVNSRDSLGLYRSLQTGRKPAFKACLVVFSSVGPLLYLDHFQLFKYFETMPAFDQQDYVTRP
jgi:hypothetical protein